MIDRPRLKPHLAVVPIDDETLFLLGERERFLLEGRMFAALVPLLDGRRSLDELVTALAGRLSPPEVCYAAVRLEQAGYLASADAAPGADGPDAAFWSGWGVPGAAAFARLADRPVALVAGPGADAAPVRRALGEAGVHVASTAPVRVLVLEDYLDDVLLDESRRARAEGAVLVPVKPTGLVAFAGPVLGGDGPCGECLAQRLGANRPVERYAAWRLGTATLVRPPAAALPASVTAGATLFALALAAWLVDAPDAVLADHLITLDTARLATERHRVLRRPQCPACGDPARQRHIQERPVVLAPRAKAERDDGGHRALLPEVTLARHAHLVSPVTGILTSLGVVPGRDHPLRIVHAASWSAAPPTAHPTHDSFNRTSLGKGRTAAQSRASALCEAIERWSAIAQGDEPRRRARLAEFGTEAVHPDRLTLYSARQYARRTRDGAPPTHRAERVPVPYDPARPSEWTPAWSLTNDARRWVPLTLAFADVALPDEADFCPYNSNGDAVGNCLEEAILQGFLELVERDAAGLWWYGHHRRPGVDLASFDAPYFRDLEAHYDALGWRLDVLDVTTDLGIPTFVAYGAPAEGGERFSIGFGCHLDARLAVQRALTELNQIFDPAGRHPLPWHPRELAHPEILRADEALPRRTAADFPSHAADDLAVDVRDAVVRAARAGLEVIVLDRTRPEVDLAAVKVVVPGLRHFWPRFAPGRLYDVPVALGWAARPRSEDELNPLPLRV